MTRDQIMGLLGFAMVLGALFALAGSFSRIRARDDVGQRVAKGLAGRGRVMLGAIVVGAIGVFLVMAVVDVE